MLLSCTSPRHQPRTLCRVLLTLHRQCLTARHGARQMQACKSFRNRTFIVQDSFASTCGSASDLQACHIASAALPSALVGFQVPRCVEQVSRNCSAFKRMQEAINIAQASMRGPTVPWRSDTIRRMVHNPVGSRSTASTQEEYATLSGRRLDFVCPSAITNSMSIVGGAGAMQVLLEPVACVSYKCKFAGSSVAWVVAVGNSCAASPFRTYPPLIPTSSPVFPEPQALQAPE